jgi:hypothetical protein
MTTELEKISANIEPLTQQQRRQIQNIIDFHGANKEKAALRISQILKQPLKAGKIQDILTA